MPLYCILRFAVWAAQPLAALPQNAAAHAATLEYWQQGDAGPLELCLEDLVVGLSRLAAAHVLVDTLAMQVCVHGCRAVTETVH